MEAMIKELDKKLDKKLGDLEKKIDDNRVELLAIMDTLTPRDYINDKLQKIREDFAKEDKEIEWAVKDTLSGEISDLKKEFDESLQKVKVENKVYEKNQRKNDTLGETKYDLKVELPPENDSEGGVRPRNTSNGAALVIDDDLIPATGIKDVFDLAGLVLKGFLVPKQKDLQILSNAIEQEYDQDAYKMYNLLDRVVILKFPSNFDESKVFENKEKKVRELHSSTKDFDDKNPDLNFDDWLLDFWRQVTRLNIESHKAIKYAAFDKFSIDTKMILGQALVPGRCMNMSVYKYFSLLRKQLLPIADLSTARAAFLSLKQNSLSLDYYFEKKLHAFKRYIGVNDWREMDFVDFFQNFCKDLTHNALALEVRKLVSDTKIRDVALLREHIIRLGSVYHETIQCNQFDEQNDLSLVSKAMQELTHTENKARIIAQAVEMDHEDPYGTEGYYYYDIDDEGYDYTEEGEFVASTDAIKTGLCHFCNKPGHFIRDCTELAKERANIKPKANMPYQRFNNQTQYNPPPYQNRGQTYRMPYRGNNYRPRSSYNNARGNFERGRVFRPRGYTRLQYRPRGFTYNRFPQQISQVDYEEPEEKAITLDEPAKDNDVQQNGHIDVVQDGENDDERLYHLVEMF